MTIDNYSIKIKHEVEASSPCLVRFFTGKYNLLHFLQLLYTCSPLRMIMKRILLLIILLCTCTDIVRAQYDAQFSQYFRAMGYYNPAYAGTTEDLNLFSIYRQQWLGIHGAPGSFFVYGDMPLTLGKTNHGVGLLIFTESVGLFQNTHVSGQYAYKRKLFGGTISAGIQFGIVNQSFDGTNVYIPESNFHQQIDGAIPTTKSQAMALDMNFGLYYTHKHFYAGLGASHLTEPELQLEENSYVFIGRTFNLTGGYNIQLKNPLYELQPSVFLLTNFQSYHADITARLVYNKMFNGGFSWRINESVALLLGATIGRFDVGYAYDFPTTILGKATSGSHEVMVKYRLKLNKTKTGKNKHKSVRIL